MRKLIAVLLSCGCLLAMLACRKQEKANPWVGVWKLDTTRSKLHEAPRQETMQIAAADQTAIKYTITGTSDDGKPYTETYDGKPDGGSYPVIVDGRELGRIAFRWQSDHACTARGSGLGGATLTETATLSDDGKSITIRSREGKEEEETSIYTR